MTYSYLINLTGESASFYGLDKNRESLENLEERVKAYIKTNCVYRILIEKGKLKCYYFDEDFIWRYEYMPPSIIPDKCRCQWGPNLTWDVKNVREEIIWEREFFKRFPKNTISCLSRLKVGEDVGRLCEMIRTMPYGTFSPEYHWKNAGPLSMERHVGKVSGLTFQRKEGNDKKNTFDFMHVTASIVGNDIDKEKWAFDHMQELYQYVLDIVSKKKSFTKFGVPVGFLRLYSAKMSKTGMLYLSFELKEISE